jgi:hypothetical protein
LVARQIKAIFVAQGTGVMASSDTKCAAGKPVTKTMRSFVARRVALTLGTAAAAGLTEGKKQKRFFGSVHARLFEAAAARSGLDSNDLLEYALARVALEDDFVEELISLEGSIDRDIDLAL